MLRGRAVFESPGKLGVIEPPANRDIMLVADAAQQTDLVSGPHSYRYIPIRSLFLVRVIERRRPPKDVVVSAGQNVGQQSCT